MDKLWSIGLSRHVSVAFTHLRINMVVAAHTCITLITIKVTVTQPQNSIYQANYSPYVVQILPQTAIQVNCTGCNEPYVPRYTTNNLMSGVT